MHLIMLLKPAALLKWGCIRVHRDALRLVGAAM